MTGAGGVLQSLVFGFGGYDITENGLVKIETVIPRQWKSVTIKGYLN
jgi:protein-glucosylgalactosylhydroxylysine glucosidase